MLNAAPPVGEGVGDCPARPLHHKARFADAFKTERSKTVKPGFFQRPWRAFHRRSVRPPSCIDQQVTAGRHEACHRSSRLPGFYRLPLARRRAAVARWADLSVEELDLWERGLDSSRADALIENVVGTYALPVGVATNFLVNGREVLVPMAVEEPSVVAAASHGALMARRGGGFEAEADAPVMIGQVQVIDLPGDDLDAACAAIPDDCVDALTVTGTPAECRARLAEYDAVLDDLLLLHACPPQPGRALARYSRLLALARRA